MVWTFPFPEDVSSGGPEEWYEFGFPHEPLPVMTSHILSFSAVRYARWSLSPALSDSLANGELASPLPWLIGSKEPTLIKRLGNPFSALPLPVSGSSSQNAF